MPIEGSSDGHALHFHHLRPTSLILTMSSAMRTVMRRGYATAAQSVKVSERVEFTEVLAWGEL